jgi:hypothetical protein
MAMAAATRERWAAFLAEQGPWSVAGTLRP